MRTRIYAAPRSYPPPRQWMDDDDGGFEFVSEEKRNQFNCFVFLNKSKNYVIRLLHSSNQRML